MQEPLEFTTHTTHLRHIFTEWQFTGHKVEFPVVDMQLQDNEWQPCTSIRISLHKYVPHHVTFTLILNEYYSPLLTKKLVQAPTDLRHLCPQSRPTGINSPV